MTESLAEEIEIENTGTIGENLSVSSLADLWQKLADLDTRLKNAVEILKQDTSQNDVSDPFRGLYISDKDVERLISRKVGDSYHLTESGCLSNTTFDNNWPESRLTWLAQAYGLSAFDLDIVLVALAPELDLRYERIYAYLQDDVSRKRPSIDLILNLLCANAGDKVERRQHLSVDSPLIQHGIVQLFTDNYQNHPPFLAHYVKVDDQIVNLLLHQQTIDSRLAPYCRILKPDIYLKDLPLSEPIKDYLQAIWLSQYPMTKPMLLYLQGIKGIGKQQIAEALANEFGMDFLIVDLAKATAQEPDFKAFSKRVFREGWFQNALIYFSGLDGLLEHDKKTQYEQFLDAVIESNWPAIFGGSRPWLPGRGELGLQTINLSYPDFDERRRIWQTKLETEGFNVEDRVLDSIAGRFKLTSRQIAEAVASHASRITTTIKVPNEDSLQPQSKTIKLGELYATLREQSNLDLAKLAIRIETHNNWDDLVLPLDVLAQLHELCQRVVLSHRVLGEWGFDCKLSYGKGVNALFSGPSGTGKTMAAEVIANELGLGLYKIDLSGIVSKYIGETEKNLDRIFGAAENANAILFFDEADALFGKRSEVHDSHDRYANIEISYLLQKMESYPGVAILATNLAKNMDEAFVRRLAFTVPFPFPDEDSRLKIWQGIWPKNIPLAENLNLELLARQFKLSGGNIKNSGLAAAYLAASDETPVSMNHLLQAIRREYQKLGKGATEVETTLALVSSQESVGVLS